MKQQEKELRDSLNWLVHLCHGCSKGGDETSPPSESEWQDCLEQAESLLDATATPEMEQLRGWLEGKSGHEDEAWKTAKGSNRDYHDGRKRAFDDVLYQIGLRHGYGENPVEREEQGRIEDEIWDGCQPDCML